MCVAARPIQSTATALRRRNAPAMTITLNAPPPSRPSEPWRQTNCSLYSAVCYSLFGAKRSSEGMDFNYTIPSRSAFLCPTVQFRKPALTASGSKAAGLLSASLLQFSRSSSVWIRAGLFICEQIRCFVMVSVSGCCSSLVSRCVVTVFCLMLLLCCERPRVIMTVNPPPRSINSKKKFFAVFSVRSNYLGKCFHVVVSKNYKVW